MNSTKRPLSITVLAAIYLIVGTAGFVFHLREILDRHALHSTDVVVELTEVGAFLCGAFLLRGRNWARWLAFAWMLFHVILSAFDGVRPMLVHACFCAVIAWILFRTDAALFFNRARNQTA